MRMRHINESDEENTLITVIPSHSAVHLMVLHPSNLTEDCFSYTCGLRRQMVDRCVIVKLLGKDFGCRTSNKKAYVYNKYVLGSWMKPFCAAIML